MKKDKIKLFLIGMVVISLTLIPVFQAAKAIDVVRDGLIFKDIYKIDTFTENPYVYDEDWNVYIDGITNLGGRMSLFRPVDPELSNKSRTFAHENTLYAWGAAMGGNPNYVKESLIQNPINSMKIENVNTGNKFIRYYIRDIARASGASDVFVYDFPMDGDSGYIVVKTTPFPTGSISAPKEVNAGEEFNVTINAEEFEPSVSDRITYTISADNTPVTSGVKFTNKINSLQIPIKLNTIGKRTLNLIIKDRVERSKTFTTVVTVKEPLSTGETCTADCPPIVIPNDPPPEIPNQPPVAIVNVNAKFYWIEEAQFQDSSYDADGEIVFSEFNVDGEPSGATKKFSRVTAPEDHTVGITVVDDDGESDTDSKTFTILPTTPTAEFSITGTMKENRKISVDGNLSDKMSPIHVAPIDYSLTNWTIRPLTEGVLPSDILIRTSSDKSKRDFLVRKPGEYEITLTVTNVLGEQSKPLSKRIVVEADKPPTAKLTVNSAKAIRDKNDNKQATIILKDSSTSEDQDIIKQRIYYVEFDSNNDGFFGTPLDEPKKVISNANQTTVNFKTSKVGNYRFSLEIAEDFGQETLTEFIKNEHYKRDTTGTIDPTGKVATYQEPVNFNTGLYDTSTEVINVPPIIDFGVRRQNSIDVVLNFGGMDAATLQHKTGYHPSGGQWDHYYYSIDETDKNRLISYASTMQANLLAKGIDANVIIDNSYYKSPDTDGEGVRDIPQYGWVDYGSYSYSSYSGTSPYSGDWEVTSSYSEPIYETRTVVTWCYYERMVWSDKEKKYVPYVISHEPPCSDPNNNVYGTEAVQVGTMYYADLRKYYSNYQYVVVSYSNQGLNSTEQVNTTDFTNAYLNQTYRANAIRMYLRMDKNAWDWMGDTNKVNSMINKTSSNNVYLWNMATPLNKINAERIITASLGRGQFNWYDSQYLYKNVKDVENYIINKFFMVEDGVTTTIVLGDKLDYTTNYSDNENDPELKREWKFIHDPTQIKGRVIDNQPSQPIAQSGLYIDAPLQLTEVGTYRVQLRAQDNPIYDGDSRFFNYRKWSDEEVQREYKIYVHRRPVADFNFTIDPNSMGLTLDPSISYDPDHQFNRSDKGIVEKTWVSYIVEGVTYNGAPPSTLSINKDYDVTLQVKDLDGAYGIVTKRISTKGYNIKPVALFDAPDMVANTQKLNIIDRSYDPNGDRLTDYKITVRRQNDSTILKTLTNFPSSFSEIGLGAGNYVIGLTIKDIPAMPPQMESDLYERNLKVIVNNRPNSNFTLNPRPLLVNELNTYQDLSSDPDGHALKNYSWTIELLNADNSVSQTWNTGVPPRDWREYGTGRFKVTQTVFDDPPYPLPSLSGSYSIIVDVVQGPQKPFALFDYTPATVIEGNTIQLNPDRSYDIDGTISAWEWSIKAPNGTVTTSTLHYPTINNAVIGTYQVSLYVRDNTNLRSEVPAIQSITVSPKPPNIPPVANFIWDPFKPTLGQIIKFNGDTSFDLDGQVVAWKWTFVGSNGTTQISTLRYPEITANMDRYTVTLEVTDDRGAKGTITQVVNVNIAWLLGKVTHTPEWSQKWVSDGYPSDVNIFYAGEKFIIRLTSSPANKVWGRIHFGGTVGLVDIPSTAFRLISTSPYEYIWEATLWRDDFVNIEEGGYMFEFLGLHPVNNPTIQSNALYIIEIKSNIYEVMKLHQKF